MAPPPFTTKLKQELLKIWPLNRGTYRLPIAFQDKSFKSTLMSITKLKFCNFADKGHAWGNKWLQPADDIISLKRDFCFR